MPMRVIAGSYRGRSLRTVPGDATRPTTDRVKEAVASSIISRRGSIEGASVLDAFAGSGALGIEMLSRGAAHATFVDNAREALQVVHANLSSVGIDPSSCVKNIDMLAASRRLPMLPGAPFDIVFLDPPYARESDEVMGLVVALARSGMLANHAIVVYEHKSTCFDPDASQALKGYNAPVDARRDGERGAATEEEHHRPEQGGRPICGHMLIKPAGSKRYGATEISYLVFEEDRG